jgi:hypothetical protein
LYPSLLLSTHVPGTQENCSYTKAAASTMGYKGIQTEYLPSSTIPVKTVDISGCKEFNYH